MSFFISKKLSTQLRFLASCSPLNKLFHFQYNFISSSSASDLDTITGSSNQEPFKVSYLINSCGLSPKQALLVSKYVNLKTPENADSVLALFKKHGFTDTQISRIVRRSPQVLLSDWESTILPKLEYFASVGLSTEMVHSFVATSPRVLEVSLVNIIIPTWSFFKSVLVSNERTYIATSRYLATWSACDLEAVVIPNIKTLSEFGVNRSTIVSLLAGQPYVVKTPNDKFRVTVEKVKEMGLNPQRGNFVLAVHALLSMSKSTWDKKVNFLKEWGWSEGDIYVAFSKNPWYMTVSKDKMSSTMDMVINKSGYDHSDIVNWPQCLTHSFEKRVVPRCLFYQVLLKRGLITGRWKLSMLLGFPEKRFMEAIMKFYKEAAPEVLKIYKEKLVVTDRELEIQTFSKEDKQADKCGRGLPNW